MAMTDRAWLRELLRKHGFTFSKAMGQNFLVNPTVCPRIAELGGAREDVGVLEIGPGIGVLTEQLARRARKVVCIELDGRLLPILDETLAGYDNVQVVAGDVMKIDLASLLSGSFGGMPVVVCANLPYYITTPILMRLLESKLPIEAVTVMVQREAALRLCAAPGEKNCGAISAAIAYYSVPRVLFTVSPGSFMPAPKVESSVIRLDLRKTPPVAPGDPDLMFSLVRGAFSQRRKTVLNSLGSATHLDKEQIGAALASCGVSPTARAEQLTLAEFSALSDAIRASL